MRTYVEESKEELDRIRKDVLKIGQRFVNDLRPRFERAKAEGDNKTIHELSVYSQVLAAQSNELVAKAEMISAILIAMAKARNGR
jgi:hypothetical protein